MLTNSAMRDYLFRLSPGDFRFETPRSVNTWYFNSIARIPGVRRILALILIHEEFAILRVIKVDSKLPDEFKVNGWKVRNKSERQDGVLWTSGGRVNLNKSSH
jgi:hypothetical protein